METMVVVRRVHARIIKAEVVRVASIRIRGRRPVIAVAAGVVQGGAWIDVPAADEGSRNVSIRISKAYSYVN